METSNLASGTYQLERLEVRTGQDIERKQLSKGHSQTRECRGQDS